MDGVRSNGSWRMLTIVGISVVTFGPGQPCGCWKNWNLNGDFLPEQGAGRRRSGPSCGLRRGGGRTFACAHDLSARALGSPTGGQEPLATGADGLVAGGLRECAPTRNHRRAIITAIVTTPTT